MNLVNSNKFVFEMCKAERLVNLIGVLIVVTSFFILAPEFAGVDVAIALTLRVAGKNPLKTFMVRKRLGFWPLILGSS